MDQIYLLSAKKQFSYYQALGERTFEQLSDDDLFWRYNDESNSIAIIVNHLWGNMKSRWTDFLTADGEKSWRNRDAEFENSITSRAQLLDKWNDGWNCLYLALDNIDQSNFNTEIFIRNQRHTVVEAINRQMTHYAYHVGQIVFIGKMVRGAEWKSLSIPLGQSQDFNKHKFSRGKHGGHFSDDAPA